MRSRKPFSAGQPSFVIFIALLLASAIVPAEAQTRKFKVLHTFHGKDGAFPVGQLTRDAEGNFYSTTEQGGTGKCVGVGCGTVFKMDKTGKLIWSYSFHGKDGFEPVAGLLRDAKGDLYGITEFGGTVPANNSFGYGVVFKLDTARTETVLHRFKGCNLNGPQDGELPDSLLVMDASGELYGTTGQGGNTFTCQGTAFALSGTGKQTILHRFTGGTDGGGPCCGLILRGASGLYGLAASGGGGGGLAFQMSTKGNETVLYNFPGGSSSESVLVADSAGNLYGTTRTGGNCGVGSCGTVFELSPDGSGWSQKTLYTFCQKSQCADGYEPGTGPLVLDKAGNIYGTTSFGGFTNQGNCRAGCGVVFKLDPSGDETVLYSFTDATDGANPIAGLYTDDKGDLFGTAQIGGDLNCPAPGGKGYGCGVVFELTPEAGSD
jgi:uncharacterized repeat protein (TIGR03803 family)